MTNAEKLEELLNELKQEEVLSLQAELKKVLIDYAHTSFVHVMTFEMTRILKHYLSDYAIEGALRAIAFEIASGKINIDIEE